MLGTKPQQPSLAFRLLFSGLFPLHPPGSVTSQDSQQVTAECWSGVCVHAHVSTHARTRICVQTLPTPFNFPLLSRFLYLLAIVISGT